MDVQPIQIQKHRSYQSTRHLATIERNNQPDGISKAILKSALSYEQKMQTNEIGHYKKVGRRFGRPADLERYGLWLYLTASRQDEPFLKPYPKINLFKPRDLPWQIVKVTRQIGKGKSKRTIEQFIPIFDAIEDELWRKVLNDYEDMEISDLLERMAKSNGRKKRSGNLTKLVQHAFKADMKDNSGVLYTNSPISPSTLKNMREYNLYIQRRMDEGLVIAILGLRGNKKFEKLNLNKKNDQLNMLKRYAKSGIEITKE